MFNEATLVGNVGRDPEIRNTQTGKLVCNLSVATSSGSGDNKQTEWHRVVLWEKSAEIAQQYVRKGTLVMIRGMIRTRKWEKDGQDRYSTEIVVGGYGTHIRTLKDSTEKTAALAESDDPPFEMNDDL
jgi:single-strand DNA-binding protein